MDIIIVVTVVRNYNDSFAGLGDPGRRNMLCNNECLPISCGNLLLRICVVLNKHLIII